VTTKGDVCLQISTHKRQVGTLVLSDGLCTSQAAKMWCEMSVWVAQGTVFRSRSAGQSWTSQLSLHWVLLGRDLYLWPVFLQPFPRSHKGLPSSTISSHYADGALQEMLTSHTSQIFVQHWPRMISCDTIIDLRPEYGRLFHICWVRKCKNRVQGSSRTSPSADATTCY